MDAIASVERLIRYNRDLFKLVNNFVCFNDFYRRKAKAIFQIGTLYIDGRGCDLCVKVDDIAKHSALATLSNTYIAYCECLRKGTGEKMTIAASFTAGDSDYLMVGRNGLFYDRSGKDWDACIVKIIEHPISISQAFWSPYKKIGRLVGQQIEKFASSRDKAVQDKAAQGIAATSQKLEEGVPKAPAPVQPFDVAKFAGIFAAIGLAFGAIGTAFVSIVTGFLKLKLWQMPIAIAGIILAISIPSMVIAWLKLRQRNLGPLLNASGWAVNTRAKINILFGSTLTSIGNVLELHDLSAVDPFADKKMPWKLYAAICTILIVIAVIAVIRIRN